MNNVITVKTSKELGVALKNKEEYIFIEGDLKNQIIRIKIAGKLAWAVAGASLGVAVILFISAPATTAVTAPVGGVGGAISFTGVVAVAVGAATVLGLPATIVAIGVAVAAGGYGAINSLRNKYKIVKKEENGILLKQE